MDKKQKLPKEWSLKEGDKLKGKKILKIEFFEDKEEGKNLKIFHLEDGSEWDLSNEGLKKAQANSTVEDLNNIVKEKEQIIHDYTDHLQRLQADFQNYMKQAEKEKERFAKYASHKLVEKLLSVIDDFEHSLKALEETEDKKKIQEGFDMVLNNLKKTLNKEGLKEIKCEGEKFDPYTHEVMNITEGEEDDIIVCELQKGYKFYDKVIRPAKVTISKKEK
jgi:molecular chaperone GrpE